MQKIRAAICFFRLCEGTGPISEGALPPIRSDSKLSPSEVIDLAPDGTRASVRVFAVNPTTAAALRGRENYTDGVTKCPRTCTDQDILLRKHKSSSCLAIAHSA